MQMERKPELEVDPRAAQFIEVEGVGHGDESMAVKPWLGAIREPSKLPVINPNPPQVEYELDFVYGYKSEEVRMNCFYNAKKRPVYMTAALGIILDPSTRKQIIFGGGEAQEMQRKQKENKLDGHNDDITCLAIDSKREMVASG